MAFTVEDGTGVEDANAYVLVADADTYMSDRARAAWASLETPQKQAAIIEATMYLDATFYWIGEIASSSQTLLWPRVNAEDREGRSYDDQVPQRVKDACCELAWIARSGSLMPTETEASIKKVKAGSVEVEYQSGNKVGEADRFAWVNRVLTSLTKGAAGGPNISLLKA
jgi:hypothetical protein